MDFLLRTFGQLYERCSDSPCSDTPLFLSASSELWGLKSGTSGLRMASPLRRSHLISVAYSFSTSRWEMHCRATEIKLLPVSHSTQSPLLLQQDAFVFVLSFFLGFAFPRWGLFAWAWRSRGSPRWGSSGCRSIHLIGTRCWLLSLTGGEQINLLFVLFKSGMKWKFILFFLNACYINLTVTDSPMIMFHKKKALFSQNVIIWSSIEMTNFVWRCMPNFFNHLGCIRNHPPYP